jgi:hypothetical protein
MRSGGRLLATTAGSLAASVAVLLGFVAQAHAGTWHGGPITIGEGAVDPYPSTIPIVGEKPIVSDVNVRARASTRSAAEAAAAPTGEGDAEGPRRRQGVRYPTDHAQRATAFSAGPSPRRPKGAVRVARLTGVYQWACDHCHARYYSASRRLRHESCAVCGGRLQMSGTGFEETGHVRPESPRADQFELRVFSTPAA